jgi:iron complex transport system ATP-binding protein
MIEVNNVSYVIQKKQILQNINLTIPQNSFAVIMGANGAGKSTLLQLMAGSFAPTSGKIMIGGDDVAVLSPEKLSKRRAVLSQKYHLPFALTVQEVVMMGRYPFFKNTPGIIDETIVTEAMQAMDVFQFAQTNYQQLSGGEAQKVQMSRVLAQILDASAQQKKYLFLDEPVSQLDIKFQYQLMHIAKSLTRRHVTVLAILHDINLALQFADSLHFIKNGMLYQSLHHPAEIDIELIHQIFGVPAIKIKNSETNFPFIYFQP